MNSTPLTRAAIGSVLALCSAAASAPANPPIAADDVDLGDWYHHLVLHHTFVAIDDEPGWTWSLRTLAGSPAVAPSFTSAGEFSWNPLNSQLYTAYAWEATVTDVTGITDRHGCPYFW
jgi:hypothetical protein